MIDATKTKAHAEVESIDDPFMKGYSKLCEVDSAKLKLSLIGTPLEKPSLHPRSWSPQGGPMWTSGHVGTTDIDCALDAKTIKNPFQWKPRNKSAKCQYHLVDQNLECAETQFLNFHSTVLLGIGLLIGLATTSGSRNQET